MQHGRKSCPDAGIDWENAFANAAYIPDGLTYPKRWSERAAAFRQSAKGRFDLAYGTHPREVMDLLLPEGAPKGLVVIIHGGYWLDFDKSSWSDLAEGPLLSGWAVALPSYTLAPEAGIAEIRQQIGRAITKAAEQVNGPIRITGHSAGGHLAACMMCANTPLPEKIAARIERVVSISGLHDLRPLMLNSMNAKLKLTQESARAHSPALLPPMPGPDFIAWVGANERPELLRQSALLAEHWRAAGADTKLVTDPGKHHFDVIDGLKDPTHPLTRALVGA
ncbi:MAG: alpha/beta hydrolase [Rhodobacterales bacterium]|nr:MAG: alpha/beta hydrolase [Rhodobacterales bacterium]